MADSRLPPIECAVTVPWPPEEAFRRFVDDFARWWPHASHSIGAERVRRLVFEARPGGRIFEEHADGRRFQWGEVRAIQPPARVSFTFHPGRDPATAQTVELRFLAQGGGTRVLLTAWDWENWGRGAARARRGYRLGWNHILRLWAGQRTVGTRLVDALGWLARGVRALRGGTAGAVRRAGGEIDRAEIP